VTYMKERVVKGLY